jgi:hypothetical protein
MASKQLETVLDLGHVFQPGTQVEAHPRAADAFTGKPITTAAHKAKVRQDGTVVFKGLEPGGPYLAHGVQKLSVPHPTRPGATETQENPINVNFTAAQPLDDEQAVRNTQASAAVVARREADARAKVLADVPAGAGVGGSGREMISGAVDTANSRPNQPRPDQVGAENRPGEVRQAGPDGVENRPREARKTQRAKGAKRNQSAAKVKATPRQRQAGKPLSSGRPSR